MTQTARGEFEVTITPQETDDGIGRLTILKTWSGDLTGKGHGLMLSAGDPTQGRAGYVALEVVDGSLALTIDDRGHSYELTYTLH